VKEANASGAPAGGQAKDDALPREPEAAAADGKSGPEPAQQAPAALDTAANTAPASLIHAAAIAVRGSPQTVANLAAQIAKKLDGRSTRFDVQLDPAGLGKVDVRVEIGANGRMSAAMAFDNPQAAAELKSRSGELQHALEQAGFDLSGGLSFDVASDQGQGQGGRAPGQQDSDSNTGAAFRGRAFQAALDTTADAAPSSSYLSSRSAASGVDIRI
jgi:flagellar hook-length control protein FliK